MISDELDIILALYPSTRYPALMIDRISGKSRILKIISHQLQNIRTWTSGRQDAKFDIRPEYKEGRISGSFLAIACTYYQGKYVSMGCTRYKVTIENSVKFMHST